MPSIRTVDHKRRQIARGPLSAASPGAYDMPLKTYRQFAEGTLKCATEWAARLMREDHPCPRCRQAAPVPADATGASGWSAASGFLPPAAARLRQESSPALAPYQMRHLPPDRRRTHGPTGA